MNEADETLTRKPTAQVANKSISKTTVQMIQLQLRASIFAGNLRAKLPDDCVKDDLSAHAAKRDLVSYLDFYIQKM